MSDTKTLRLAPPVAAALSELGWSASHPALREAAPVAARGHNLVLVAPPSPAWAAPVLGGALTHQAGVKGNPLLALAPGHAVGEWARTAERVAAGSGIRLAGIQASGRLARLLRSDLVDFIVTSPETAHLLVGRSVLKMDTLAGILLLWPEAWDAEAETSALLHEASKDSQRIIVTADPAGSAPLIERYCWRAPLVDLLGVEPTEPAPAVKSLPVAWRGRLDALADLVGQLDPESLAVWAADLGHRDAIARALAATGVTAEITNRIPAPASLIVAFDLPDPASLRELATRGEVLLLVPPGTEAYAARLTTKRAPMHPSGLLERAQNKVGMDREEVLRLLERPGGAAPASYLAIAPLLERHEATSVAAALYQLWTSSADGQAEPTPAARTDAKPTRLWVGIGRRDAVTPHDLVGSLVKECGVPKEGVGRIEIRETFSLIELGANLDPEEVAESLRGKTIRRRRLAVRLDRGRTKQGER